MRQSGTCRDAYRIFQVQYPVERIHDMAGHVAQRSGAEIQSPHQFHGVWAES